MTVKELIAKLSVCSQDKDVVFICDDDGFCVGADVILVVENENRVAMY